jgi:hypothetical protein
MSDKALFGRFTPAEASRRRWENARKTKSEPAVAADPREAMLASLQQKAQAGDVQAVRAWRELRAELEFERAKLAAGAEVWETVTVEDRAFLLALLALPDDRLEQVFALVEELRENA